MNWFKKILGSTAKKNVDQAVSNPTDYTIDILMSNLCDIEKSLPILEDAGISREAISKTYNLTVIACARGMHRKKNIAMKKLSVASTTQSKPIHDVGSVCPKWV